MVIEIITGVLATVLGFVVIRMLNHIIKKIDRANNRTRLSNYKIDSLAETTSQQMGNGKFKAKYDHNLEMKMKEDDFVYKEI